MAGEQEIRGSKNLGMVKAIHVGTTPPLNTKMIWYDSNLNQQVHKIYNVSTGEWIPITGNGGGSQSFRYEFLSTGSQVFDIPSAFSRVTLVSANGQLLSDRVYSFDTAARTVTITDLIPPDEYVIIVVETSSVSTTVQILLQEFAENFTENEVATAHEWFGNTIYRKSFVGLTPAGVGDAVLFAIPGATEVIKYNGFVNESINTTVRRNIDNIPSGDLERQAFYTVGNEAHFFLSNVPDPDFISMPYIITVYYIKA